MTDATSIGELVIRLGLSLTVVVGLVWVLARVVRRRGLPGLPGFGPGGSRIEVIGRQSVGRSASLAVVRVGERTMVVGITEGSVRVLGEGDDLASGAPPLERERARRTALDGGEVAVAGGGATHPARMNLIEALRELTIRRS